MFSYAAIEVPTYVCGQYVSCIVREQCWVQVEG